jgi:hypothetical protein
VWLWDTAKLQGDTLWASSELPNGGYRLLVNNQDRLHLVRPARAAPALGLPLLVLPWNEVKAIRVLRNYAGCQ